MGARGQPSEPCPKRGCLTFKETSSSCVLLGICQRKIHARRTPDSGPKQRRKAFPEEVKTLGDLLRKRRSEHGLDQRELAAMLEVPRDRNQAWERDESMPSAEEWVKLAVVLDLPATPAEARPNSGFY